MSYGSCKHDSFADHLVKFRLAASFLTVLPVGPKAQASPQLQARSFGYFPLVGFLLGLLLTVEDIALAHLLAAPIRSALVILSCVVITGAIHLDAIADTADALGAGRDRDRAMEILRDSRIGVFGALALIFYLLLDWAALASLQGYRRAAALYLAPGLGRWAMVWLASKLEYLRFSGAGSFLQKQYARTNLRTGSLVTLVAVMPVISPRALAAMIAAVAAVFGLRRAYSWWLGGVTGDLIGATGGLVELTTMIIMASR